MSKAESTIASLNSEKSALLETSSASTKETQLLLTKANEANKTLESEKVDLSAALENVKTELKKW